MYTISGVVFLVASRFMPDLDPVILKGTEVTENNRVCCFYAWGWIVAGGFCLQASVSFPSMVQASCMLSRTNRSGRGYGGGAFGSIMLSSWQKPPLSDKQRVREAKRPTFVLFLEATDSANQCRACVSLVRKRTIQGTIAGCRSGWALAHPPCLDLLRWCSPPPPPHFLCRGNHSWTAATTT